MKVWVLILLFYCCLLSGCATVSNENTGSASATDPFERMNRATSEFNDSFDENIFQPIARGYIKVTPRFVQKGIGNFFGNINDAWTSLNSFLQGNVQDGLTDFMRFAMNSTFGLLGVLDMASEAKIPKHNTDFGQTLGVWGIPNGPYLVLPFLGSSVVRNTLALPLDDYYGDLWSYYRPRYIRNTGTVIRLIDKRAAYLDSYSLLEDAALDKYIFIRDAYLQRIAGQIEMRKNSEKNREEALEMRQQEEKSATQESTVLQPSSNSNTEAPQDVSPLATPSTATISTGNDKTPSSIP